MTCCRIDRGQAPFAVAGSALMLFIVFLLSLIGNVAFGHELRPAIVDVVIDTEGAARVTVATNAEALVAGIGPGHGDTGSAPNSDVYDRLRSLSAAELRVEIERIESEFFSGMELRVAGQAIPLTPVRVHVPAVGDRSLARISEFHLISWLPVRHGELTWRYAARFGDSVLRVRSSGDPGTVHASYVAAGAFSGPVDISTFAPPSGLAVFSDYVILGFEHILPRGLDHILFVVGLFLLSTRLRPLLWQVTGFTLAHSVSLALGMLGLVRLSPEFVEPLIALSIVYVAVENIFTDRLKSWRSAVVFAFGLLHGLGFAGVLTEIGLPNGQFVTGLIAFNLGVELGQLVVIALCFLAVGFWFGQRAWYRSVVVMPGSLAIAMIASFWVVQRVG